MIAQHRQVVAKLIHYLHFHLAAIECEEKCALHGIARINEQHIRLGSPDAVDKHLTALHSAKALVGRVELAVSIVGLQNHKFFGIGITAAQQKCQRYNQKRYSLHKKFSFSVIIYSQKYNKYSEKGVSLQKLCLKSVKFTRPYDKR